jgi:hypothetical protein
MTVSLAARKATNMFGKLTPDLLARLDAVVDNPTEETWDDAYSIIIATSPRSLTLWQAVLRVDPTFPNSGPVYGDGGSRISGWTAIPSRDVLLAAIERAVSA